jgi:hypothetical protein
MKAMQALIGGEEDKCCGGVLVILHVMVSRLVPFSLANQTRVTKV